MRFIFLILIFLNFSYSSEFENGVDDFFKDWDNAHNNKNIGLFDKLYLESVNYYNSKSYSKFQILDDKIRILKKYPEFKQSSKIVSKEQVSNQLIKVNYEKSTFYSNRNRTFNSYLILDTSNEQLKIFEENDNKNEKDITFKTNDIPPVKQSKIENSNNVTANNHSNKSVSWNDLRIEKYKWNNIGINNPNIAKQWEDTVPQFIHIQDWIKNGFNVNQVKEWLDAGTYITVDYVKDGKLKDPQELKQWVNIGFIDLYSIYKIKKLGILTPEEAKKWKALNIELDDSFGGVSSCIYAKLSPQEVNKWLDIGEKYCEDIHKWKKLGINNPDEAVKWINYKLYPHLIEPWFLINIKSHLEIKNWISAGVKPREVKEWLSNNISSDEAIDWIKNGSISSLEEILELKSLGINSSKDFKGWSNTRFGYLNFNDVKRLKESGINYPEELDAWNLVVKDISSILIWKNLKINSPIEANEWLDIGVNYAKAKELIEMNYKPNDLKNYSPHILSSSQIKVLIDLNMISNPLIESMSKHNNLFNTKENFIKYLNILTKNKCSIIEQKYFYLADEFDNEDLCYLFNGTLIQRLSKTDGLMSSMNIFSGKEYINYIIFDDSWSEGTYKSGIVKGLGGMKYETSLGIQKLVRKGKVISFF